MGVILTTYKSWDDPPSKVGPEAKNMQCHAGRKPPAGASQHMEFLDAYMSHHISSKIKFFIYRSFFARMSLGLVFVQVIFRGFYGRFGPWDVPKIKHLKRSTWIQVLQVFFFVPDTVDGKDIPRPTTGKHTKNPMKPMGRTSPGLKEGEFTRFRNEPSTNIRGSHFLQIGCKMDPPNYYKWIYP